MTGQYLTQLREMSPDVIGTHLSQVMARLLFLRQALTLALSQREREFEPLGFGC